MDKNFKKLLSDPIKFKYQMRVTDYKDNKARGRIIEHLDSLLSKPPEKSHKEIFTFYKRMVRDKNQLFTFLFFPQVPTDNNASERAIRNIKVKQKISSQFNNENAVQNFAKIRTVIDTAIKNGINIFDSLMFSRNYSC